MGFFDLDYNQKAIELLPPDKRGSKFVAWIKALLSQVQYNQNKILRQYRLGTLDQYANWTAPQNKGSIVVYGQSVYECISEIETYEPPTNTRDWRVYLEYFIGTEERILYNHIKLTLEYALNMRFNKQFYQPPAVSDIYVTTNAPIINVFVVGENENESSVVLNGDSQEVVIDAYTFDLFNNYTIHIPIATYISFGSTDAQRQATVRNFADKYNTIGLNYNIVTY
jgi:hypothetical protein